MDPILPNSRADAPPDSPREEDLPEPDFAVTRTLKRELLAELSGSSEGCTPVTPEELLARWPTNPHADPDVASLLFEDFLNRRKFDKTVTIDQYHERFPEHKDSLASLVRFQEVAQSLGGSSAGHVLRLPAVGEELFGFRLRVELGRGSFARVFLAEQADLAGRPVVLKVSDIAGHEPQTLAQLQHTHIVPIYSVHEDARAGLRAVCMPYFGGAALSAVLETLWDTHPNPTRGAQLVEALEAVQKPVREAFANLHGAREWALDPKTLAHLGSLDYVRSGAWVLLQLAEALEHAHLRGVLHRDIKPSNVLLSSEGQPMLLDFNLAQDSNNTIQATLGGTVAYMAPEHLRALASRDPNLARQVDQRADLYSLGMVLYEMLTGKSPFGQSASYAPLQVLVEAMALERSRAAPSLRKERPDVPWSLESIARKCLAPDPTHRYQRAADLAEDLRRFLDDRPLKHAPELSRVEQVRKWTRRHPRLTSVASVGTPAVAACLVITGALFLARQHLADAREELGETQEHLEASRALERRQAFEQGAVRALCLVNTTSDWHDPLEQGIQACEATLGLYQVLEEDNWQARPAWKRLAPGERRRLAEDARELLLLLAWGRVQSAPQDPHAAEQALSLLARAEAVQGLEPLRALWEDRAHYLAKLGKAQEAAEARKQAGAMQPASARDHYLLATTFARKGRYAEAVAQLDQALALQPRHYWSWGQRGICHKELGDLVQAAGDFGVCVGLWPELAWGHFNRGCVQDQAGKHAEAIASYGAALRNDPGFVLGYLNRGLARLDVREFAPALEDFEQAARRGREDVLLQVGRARALEGLKRYPEADEAFAAALSRVDVVPEPTRSLLRMQYGFAVYKRLPRQAREAFAQVLREQPQNAQALYGVAMVLVEQRQPGEALKSFDLALEANPGFAEARRFRAVLLARGRRLNEAIQDVNRCLEQAPRDGAALYAAACVMALGAEQATDRRTEQECARQAIEFLQRAFREGYGQAQAGSDPDLIGISRDPTYLGMIGKVKPADR